MPAPAGRAWALLQDIERVAACMPGARITERIDPQHYKGTVAVRFGPANLSFRGDLELAAIEPATRTLRLLGQGTDTPHVPAPASPDRQRGTPVAVARQRPVDVVLQPFAEAHVLDVPRVPVHGLVGRQQRFLADRAATGVRRADAGPVANCLA